MRILINEQKGSKVPLIDLTMPQMAYASLVWSLQDFSSEDFISALVEHKSAVAEKYGELTEIANLPFHSWRMPRVFQRFLDSMKN